MAQASHDSWLITLRKYLVLLVLFSKQDFCSLELGHNDLLPYGVDPETWHQIRVSAK